MLRPETFVTYTHHLFIAECFLLGLIILAVRQRSEFSTLLLSMTFLWCVVRDLIGFLVDASLIAQHPRLHYLPQVRGFETSILYLYTRYLLQLLTRFRHWMVLLPSILLFLAYSLALVLGIERVPFLQSTLDYQNTVVEIGLWSYDLLLFGLTFQLIYQQERRFRQYLSNLQAVRLNWVRAFFATTLLISTYENISNCLDYFWGIKIEENLWVTFVLLLIYGSFFFVITYYGLKYPSILRGVLASNPERASEPTLDETPKRRYEKSKLDDVRLQALYNQVRAYLESEEEPYRQPDLRLLEIATQLNQPTAYLSQAIGQCSSHGNFYNWVNYLRVEAVKRRLQQPGSDRLTLLGIAQECGFTSQQTFGKAFKQFTGQTPSQYRMNLKTSFAIQ